MKAEATILKSERALRKRIDATTDPVEARVAQAMETALRWARLKTVGWTPMHTEPAAMAKLIRAEWAPNRELIVRYGADSVK